METLASFSGVGCAYFSGLQLFVLKSFLLSWGSGTPTRFHITALRWREQAGRGSGSGNSIELHSSASVEKTGFSHLNSVLLSSTDCTESVGSFHVNTTLLDTLL